MKKTNKEKVKEFIRVDHAGERGAVKIYEGQLLALNTFVKDESLKKKIEEMKIHEKEHCEYFENEIKKRNIKPTKFLPLWDLLGVGLGFGSKKKEKKPYYYVLTILIMWICRRCNLRFNLKMIKDLHTEITTHKVEKIES